MSDDPRIVNMVARLIEETATGGLVWRIGDVPRTMTLGSNNVFTLFVETNFRGTRFAVYEMRSRHFTDVDEYYWVDAVVFAVLDQQDRVLWQMTGTAEVYELFNDVRRRVAGVDKLLNYFR